MRHKAKISTHQVMRQRRVLSLQLDELRREVAAQQEAAMHATTLYEDEKRAHETTKGQREAFRSIVNALTANDKEFALQLLMRLVP